MEGLFLSHLSVGFEITSFNAVMEVDSLSGESVFILTLGLVGETGTYPRPPSSLLRDSLQCF